MHTHTNKFRTGALSFDLSLYYRAGYVLSTMFVATEVSTPCINAHWHMHEGGCVGWA